MNLLNKPNRIKQYANSCIHCWKGYKTKTKLDKHYLIYDLIYSRNRILDEEEEILPSQKQMFQKLTYFQILMKVTLHLNLMQM